MKKIWLGSLLSVVFAGGLLSSAQAAILLTEGGLSDPTAGQVSAVAPTTYTFDGGGTAPFSGSVTNFSTSVFNVAAAPFGDSTPFVSVGSVPPGSNSSPQSASVSFGSGVTYVGLYWGSVDAYNSITFYNGATELGTFTGSQVRDPANGFQGDTGSVYTNFFSNGGPLITSATFTTTGVAFEIDNLTAAVPEPATWALMLLGFAGLGFMGYRGRRPNASFRLA